jgi:hypothetical protein
MRALAARMHEPCARRLLEAASVKGSGGGKPDALSNGQLVGPHS